MVKDNLVWLLISIGILCAPSLFAQDDLPGSTTIELGHLDIKLFDTNGGPECEIGTIVVPEN